MRSDPRFTLRTVEATVRPSPKEANGLEVTSAHATPVIKPLSLVRSETLVGTEMSIVVSVEEFAVKVPTKVLFFWIVRVALLTVGNSDLRAKTVVSALRPWSVLSIARPTSLLEMRTLMSSAPVPEFVIMLMPLPAAMGFGFPIKSE